MSQVFDKNFERNNRLKALAYTILVNVILFLIIISIKIWSVDPTIEIQTGGFEINYGDSEVGSGNIETLNSTNPNDSKEEESVENAKFTTSSNLSNQSSLISSTEKSPVKISENESVKNTTVEIKNDKNNRVVKSEPIINNNALFKSRPKKGGNSNGDDIDKIGDKGQLDGDLNNGGRYFGSKGSGGGSEGGIGQGNGLSMNIAGWRLKSQPKVNDETNESGSISFFVKIDDTGTIISLEQRESTISLALSRKYKDAVSRLKFVPNSKGTKAPISSGTITFYINAR